MARRKKKTEEELVETPVIAEETTEEVKEEIVEETIEPTVEEEPAVEEVVVEAKVVSEDGSEKELEFTVEETIEPEPEPEVIAEVVTPEAPVVEGAKEEPKDLDAIIAKLKELRTMKKILAYVATITPVKYTGEPRIEHIAKFIADNQ